MRMQSKKCTAVLLAAVMILFSAQAEVSAMPAPRVAVQISMTTDADPTNEVRANDIITAAVTFKSVLAQIGEQITIQVTNGAEILIDEEADVQFQADGTATPVRDVVRGEDGNIVTLYSGTPALSPLNNKIVFQIKAPSRSGDFSLSVKIGPDAAAENPLINYTEQEFTVKPFITVNTSLDIIAEEEPFEIFGEIEYEDAFMVAMEIRGQETGNAIYSSTTVEITSSREYHFGTFSFNDTHTEGTYMVEVVLLDSGMNPVLAASKEIIHEKEEEIPQQAVNIKQIVEKTGDILFDRTFYFDYGKPVSIPPLIIFTHYRLTGILLNGQPVEGDRVELVITGPLEIVFLHEELFGIGIECVHASNGSLIVGMISSEAESLGATVYVTAPDIGYTVVGVLVNGQRAALLNGNQVKVTMTGHMSVTFEYQ